MNKFFISSLNMFWNKEGQKLYTGVGTIGITSEKQNKELEKLLEKIEKIILKESKRIAKL